MIKVFLISMENMGHTGLIKMKIKFTQQPNVFCDANCTYTHSNAIYVGKVKT
jgi:hypothetical protein